MTLSCDCGDFCPSDYEAYWWLSPPFKSDIAATCCECRAPIGPGEIRTSITFYESDEPDEAPPYDPYDYCYEPSEAEERRMDAWKARHGWNGDNERCEQQTGEAHRCERCSDLQDALSNLGFCVLEDGNLLQAHEEYCRDFAGTPVIWQADAHGVLQPVRQTS